MKRKNWNFSRNRVQMVLAGIAASTLIVALLALLFHWDILAIASLAVCGISLVTHFVMESTKIG